MQRGQARRPRSSAFRLLAALLVVAFALGQAFLTAHLILVPHRLCAEHGVAEHGGQEPVATSAATKNSAVAPSIDNGSGRLSDVALYAKATPDGHESCVFRATRESLPAASADAFYDLRIDTADMSLGSALDTPLVSSLDVLGFAPKQSPPTRQLRALSVS